MRRYWAWRRTDFLIAVTALVGVLLTTVLIGPRDRRAALGRFLLYRASRPYVAALGRIPGYRNTFGDLQRHPDAEVVPDLLLVRLDAPLYFFNANVAKTQILDLVAARDPAPRGILIDLAATADLDVTTTDMLFELVADLEERSIEPMLAQVKGSVRDRMRRTGLMERIGEDRLYLSMGAGVTDFLRRRGGGEAVGPRAWRGRCPRHARSRLPDRPGVHERLAGASRRGVRCGRPRFERPPDASKPRAASEREVTTAREESPDPDLGARLLRPDGRLLLHLCRAADPRLQLLRRLRDRPGHHRLGLLGRDVDHRRPDLLRRRPGRCGRSSRGDGCSR